MTVNGVNNSNAGAYAAGAAVVGGAAGAATGYFTKNIVKDGKYTDEFVSRVVKNQLNTDEGKALQDILKLDLNSKTLSDDFLEVLTKHKKTIPDVDEVIKFLKNVKDTPGASDIPKTAVKALQKTVAPLGVKIGKDCNFVEMAKKKMPEDLDEVYDISKKAFKEGIDESDDIVKCAKKAISDVKWKAAGIYGGIAAAVLGLGTYLCCAGKKAPEAEQRVDAQA